MDASAAASAKTPLAPDSEQEVVVGKGSQGKGSTISGSSTGTRSNGQGSYRSSDGCSLRSVQDLPDVMDRIERLGVTAEYIAYRDRYLSWRRGEARGAQGQLEVDDLTREPNVAANRGFGYHYPTMQEWVFRRTISFWIAVTFFEGSIFFTLSSFMYNCKDMLGDLFEPLTFYGYCCGKFLFISGCYLMCVECVNFGCDDDEDTTFYYNPLRYKTAFRRLKKAGAGVLPYFISISYSEGVTLFAVGLVIELLALEDEQLSLNIKLTAFILGSLGFAAGGALEAYHNGTFTTLSMTIGWWAALCNFLGGVAFLLGSCLGWSNPFASNISFGVGSAFYLVGSGVTVVMWKDEQYGLTFIGVINKFHRQDPISHASTEASDGEHGEAFSWWGAAFVTIACICGAASAYNFNIELKRYLVHAENRAGELAVLEVIPCVIAHLVLILLSAVTRSPKTAPFLHLFVMMKVALVLVTGYSVYSLCCFLLNKH